ncbi:hypothetical protein ILUMI_24031 [Ignelater luminosus]|uniref:Uncharacterized protein n=1 Tax=Ignelater luminosus TaxID=2038154 RepID=A0A8K0FWQ1_IGNLU|nr:hypothetical protein ILUMI_24031 [Ignelater luminosus]
MEVVEDSSVINVEYESSKSHLESTGYGDITKLSREDTFKRRVKKDKEDGFTSSDGSERNSNDEDNPQPPAKIPRRQSKMKGIKQKVHNEMTENVLEWLELLPKVPSHYCRSSSSCTCVESVFRSISHMHKVYEEWCGQKEVKAVSRSIREQTYKDSQTAQEPM